ncbi:MAG TPA: hypothetical protein VFT59_02250 [Candidatus Saccharimonadales bacterium]|nr:hypothetical protein [Candidatus Saccharimonadales bacterium]
MIMKPASNKKRNIIITICIALVLLLAGAAAYFLYFKKTLNINSYEDCVAAGNPSMESSPPQCSTPDGKHFTDTNSQVTIEGTAVCLPHKNADGPQTMECAVGVKTDAGMYYGISGDKDNQLAGVAGSDQKVRVSGIVEKVNDSTYDITQLIAVKNIDILN